MKLSLNVVYNFVLISLFMVFLCGFQTSFWYQLFGNVPAPLLWINLIVYLTLYRKPFTGIWFVYAMGYIAAAYSLMPLKMMFISLLILFTFISVIKSRVFWSGSGYYMMMSIFAAVSYHLIYFFLSWGLESNHSSFQPLERMVQIILTPSFAFPIYWTLAKLDRWTRCEVLQESGGVEL